MASRVRVIAPAKVNLFLGVGPLRDDGYHAVRTVLHPLALHDEVIVSSADSLALRCSTDLGVSAEDNLVWRAATLLAQRLGREPAVCIELLKRVPHGAGLGGGSSDAAGTLVALATIWDLDPGSQLLTDVAQALGADVAFFLSGGAALMSGRGDVIERALPSLETPLVLVRPERPVSTAAAYRAFDRAPQPVGEVAPMVAALQRGDDAGVAAALFNNLEAASSSVVPEVGDALAWVRGRPGVLGAAVAGSGSAVFALVESEATSAGIAAEAAARGWWSAASALAAKGVHVVDEAGR